MDFDIKKCSDAKSEVLNFIFTDQCPEEAVDFCSHIIEKYNLAVAQVSSATDLLHCIEELEDLGIN